MSQLNRDGDSASKTLRSMIESDAWMMTALRVVEQIELRDWWIVAGFVRCKVWDTLHGFAEPTAPTDIDVVFFDPERPADEDRDIESRLRRLAPSYPWEVYNQAHMHEFNGDQPYDDCVDAFSRWAETVSTVGVTLDGGDLRLASRGCGLDDLMAMVIRPNPHPDAQLEIFEHRLRTKAWRQQWPLARLAAGATASEPS